MKAPLTQSQAKALAILAKRPGVTPGMFAGIMWKDRPGLKAMHKCGPYGVSRGGMMNMSAGSYLCRLQKKGWVRGVFREYNREWFITVKGRKILREYRDWVFEKYKRESGSYEW